MNASEARKLSMKNIEKILWEQIDHLLRYQIECAVNEDRQEISVNVKGKKKANYYGMKDDVEKLRMLGYSVCDDSITYGDGQRQEASNVWISW